MPWILLGSAILLPTRPKEQRGLERVAGQCLGGRPAHAPGRDKSGHAVFAQNRTLISYEGRFSYADKLALSLLCQALGVSKSAAVIRLRQLGYLEERPYAEFVDPLEVWA